MSACAPYILDTAGSERVKCACKICVVKQIWAAHPLRYRSENVFVLRINFAATHIRFFYCRWIHYQPTAGSCRSMRVPCDHNHALHHRLGQVFDGCCSDQESGVLRKPGFRKTLKKNNNAVCAKNLPGERLCNCGNAGNLLLLRKHSTSSTAVWSRR